MINELPQNIKTTDNRTQSKSKSESRARLVISINGKNYYASDFVGKPIELLKDSYLFVVRDEQKKYQKQKRKKGEIVGDIYAVTKGSDGQLWISMRQGQKKFFHIPAKYVIDSNYIKKYLIKSVETQQKEFEQKLKEKEKKGFFPQLNTTLLLLLGGLALIKDKL